MTLIDKMPKTKKGLKMIKKSDKEMIKRWAIGTMGYRKMMLKHFEEAVERMKNDYDDFEIEEEE